MTRLAACTYALPRQLLLFAGTISTPVAATLLPELAVAKHAHAVPRGGLVMPFVRLVLVVVCAECYYVLTTVHGRQPHTHTSSARIADDGGSRCC